VDDRGARAVTGLRALAAAALCAAGLGAAAAQAHAVIPQGNVLLNPGGETGAAATDGISNICPQGWTCNAMFPRTTLVRYGTTTFPGAAESTRIGGGNNFFAGGPDNNLSGAEQIVDLGTQPEFTTGAVKVTYGGCLGGFGDQNDLARVLLTFRTVDDPDGLSPSNTVSLDGPTAAQRGNATAFRPVFQTVTVPPTTHSFRLTVSFQRDSVGYNDGYADNLSVVFGPTSGPNPSAPPCATPGGGGGPGPGPGPGPSPGPGGGGKPLRLLSFGPAVVSGNGTVRMRVTCNTTQISRCRGKLTATLVGGAKPKAKRRLGAASYVVASRKSKTVRITPRPAVVKAIGELSKKQLARARIKLTATTNVSGVKFRQTSSLRVRRPT
jgi:hypothetical protein